MNAAITGGSRAQHAIPNTAPSSVQAEQNPGQCGNGKHPPPGHGLPVHTVNTIRQCLREQFPQQHWVELYGSRAIGRHWRGSEINLAFSADENCSAALQEALDQLPTPYLFDVTHWESLQHSGLREHIERVGTPFP